MPRKTAWQSSKFPTVVSRVYIFGLTGSKTANMIVGVLFTVALHQMRTRIVAIQAASKPKPIILDN
jgi:hypothetical protein